MNNLFANKQILITGATGGIGRALALELASYHAHLILVGRKASKLEKLDDEIQKQGGTATLVPLDLSDAQGIEQMAVALAQRFGKIDMVIAGAAEIGDLAPLHDFDRALWDRVMNVNVTANWRLLRAFHPLLAQAEDPLFLWLDDAKATKNEAYWGLYNISKAAIRAMIATYMAENKTGKIRAVTMTPQPTATNLRLQAFPGEDQADLQTPETAAQNIINFLETELGRSQKKSA